LFQSQLKIHVIGFALILSFISNILNAESDTSATITVVGATYASKVAKPPHSTASCSANAVDMTSLVSSACDGKEYCNYSLAIPSKSDDPALGCYKNFQVKYRCSSDTFMREIDAGGVDSEASGKSYALNCRQHKGINVLQATYGHSTRRKYQTCKSVVIGNSTGSVTSQCNGKMTCDYKVESSKLGDPSPGCLKNFVVDYTCSGVDQRQETIPMEANGKSIRLSCLKVGEVTFNVASEVSVPGKVVATITIYNTVSETEKIRIYLKKGNEDSFGPPYDLYREVNVTSDTKYSVPMLLDPNTLYTAVVSVTQTGKIFKVRSNKKSFTTPN